MAIPKFKKLPLLGFCLGEVNLLCLNIQGCYG